MADQAAGGPPGTIRVLLIDDEDAFRKALVQQLTVRGFEVIEVDNGLDAIKRVRHDNPQVVILDQIMPGMDGVETLKELKRVKPETQVIMLTGHGSADIARITGRHDVFSYLEKPCGIDELVSVIRDAAQERIYALARHEIPVIRTTGLKRWLLGAHNHRPGLILLGVLLFLTIVFMPTPGRLTELLSASKAGIAGEKIAGYSEYRKMATGETVAGYYSDKAGWTKKTEDAPGTIRRVPLTTEQAATRAKVMVGLLTVAALFWATGAIPIGITALLVGAGMILFGVLPPELTAKAYAKDSVIFIFGVLALSAAIGKTGLDRRIGMILLGMSSSLTRYCLIFAPLLAMTASFLSEHALVAFLTPILFVAYTGAVKASGLKQDRSLLVLLFLLLTYAANVGGPGSPAAGGRNAVMIGILSDYGISVTFGQWVKLGFAFVPVMALVIGAYFLLVFRKKIRVTSVDIAAEVRKEAAKIGSMTHDEYKAASVLAVLIFLWVGFSDLLGMGGPVILALVAMNVLGIARWRDINAIHWDVVALYAAAGAMGTGLALTGAALWLADGFVALLPHTLMQGTGLCIAASFITGILTNFMSDGATVAAVGPITVPMATLSGTSPVLAGLATAFASSFAHMLVIGTPNNAIVYAMARDPETGEQLLTMKDFLVHGSVVLLLSFAILWSWVILGYWQWM